MFGNNTYWWFGLLTCLLFVSLNVVVFLLRDKPKVSYAIAWCIACYLFCLKVAEYTYWQAVGQHYKFPVEFSALSYFMYGIAVTFRLKKIQQFPLWAGFMAGFIFSAALWISPDSYAISDDVPFWHWMGYCNHHLLYLGAMLMIANVAKLNMRNWWQQVVGGLACVAYSWLIYLFTDYANQVEKPLIIQMTDGSILGWLGVKTIEPWHYIVYFIGVVVLLVLTMGGYLLLNRWQWRRRERKGVEVDYFPAKWLSVSVDWE